MFIGNEIVWQFFSTMEKIGLIKNDLIKKTFGNSVRFLSNVGLKGHRVKPFLHCYRDILVK